jgi:hypothetical protein
VTIAVGAGDRADRHLAIEMASTGCAVIAHPVRLYAGPSQRPAEKAER